MASDPVVGGAQRLIIYPTYGVKTGFIDLSIRTMSSFGNDQDMKPVNTVKDYNATLRTTGKAEVSTTHQVKIVAEAFREGEISIAVREACFRGKPVGGFAAYLEDDDVYYGKFTGKLIHKPNDVENFQEYSLEINSFGDYLVGTEAIAAIAALV